RTVRSSLASRKSGRRLNSLEGPGKLSTTCIQTATGSRWEFLKRRRRSRTRSCSSSTSSTNCVASHAKESTSVLRSWFFVLGPSQVHGPSCALKSGRGRRTLDQERTRNQAPSTKDDVPHRKEKCSNDRRRGSRCTRLDRARREVFRPQAA